MKNYKQLVSSAPAHSSLNAQAFHYRNSVETDIRKTFARIRRDQAKGGAAINRASNVRQLKQKPSDAALHDLSLLAAS
jgi:hypothetical protein